MRALISLAEYERMPTVGHRLFGAVESGSFFGRKGQLPDVTEADLKRLPLAMKRIPTGGMWDRTEFRRGEVWQLAGRFWYVKNSRGVLEFNPQDARLPEPLRRLASGEGGGRGSRGRSGSGRRGSSSGSGRYSGGSRDSRRD